METVSTPPRRRRGLRILCCILLVLTLAGSVWFFWLPKKLFAFLKADQVEAVWLTWGDSPEILMNREDQEKLVEQLSQVSFEYWVSKKAADRTMGQYRWQYRLLLKNGTSFTIDVLNSAHRTYRLNAGFFGCPVLKGHLFTFQMSAASYLELGEMDHLNWKYGFL